MNVNQYILNKQVIEAAEKGQTDVLWKLVEQGANINARDMDKQTPLMWLAVNGHLTAELLGLFVRNGADIEARNKNGWTALMKLAAYGRLTPELLEAFASNGADVNAQNLVGNTALMWSAREGYLTLELIDAFVKNGTELDIRNYSDSTALMYSAMNGYLTPKLLGAFKKHGADVNARDKWGTTVLSLALKRQKEDDIAGKERVLFAFFCHGAKIDFKEQYINGFEPAIVRFLLKTMETNPALALKIIKEQPGEMFEHWVEKNIPDTEELLAKVSAHLGILSKDSIMVGF